MPRAYQIGFGVFPLGRDHANAAVRQAWLHDYFPDDADLDRLADGLALTSRTFLRRFKAATGETPLVYLRRLRTEAAEPMLKEGSQDRPGSRAWPSATKARPFSAITSNAPRVLRPVPIANAMGGRAPRRLRDVGGSAARTSPAPICTPTRRPRRRSNRRSHRSRPAGGCDGRHRDRRKRRCPGAWRPLSPSR